VAGPRHGTPHSPHLPPMSKRHVVGSSWSHKRRKGSSHAQVDLDEDEPSGKVELIRIWDVATSKTTGRASATSKIHRHVKGDVAKPRCEEPTPAIEDIDTPANDEPSGQPPTTSAKKRKKGKPPKQNDSVSSAPIHSSKLIVIPRQTKMID